MITENYRVVSPAYGRDYSNKHEAEQAFTQGKDFLLQPESCYCSIRDFQNGVKVEIRYLELKRCTIIEVEK